MQLDADCRYHVFQVMCCRPCPLTYLCTVDRSSTALVGLPAATVIEITVVAVSRYLQTGQETPNLPYRKLQDVKRAIARRILRTRTKTISCYIWISRGVEADVLS